MPSKFLAIIVLEPPPSNRRAITAPSDFINWPLSSCVNPGTPSPSSSLPLATTKKTEPSALIPTFVLGARTLASKPVIEVTSLETSPFSTNISAPPIVPLTSSKSFKRCWTITVSLVVTISGKFFPIIRKLS